MAQGPRASQEKPSQSSWTSFWRKTRIGDLARDWDMHKFLKIRLGTEGAQLFPQKPTICDSRCTNVPKEKTGFRIQDVHLSQSKLGPWTQGDKLLEKDWGFGIPVFPSIKVWG